MEKLIMERIQEITEQYSELPQLEKYDLTLEAVGENGDVRATLKKGGTTFEKLIKIDDDLGFIEDTFSYPNTFTPRSKDFAVDSVKMAYFGIYGDLMVEHKDGTVEQFKVKDDQKESIAKKLRANLGDKIKL
jgi:hypothetical protein